MFGVESCKERDYTEEELEFAVFCVENVAEALGVDAGEVYDAWTKGSDILEGYVIPGYSALHTQGKGYIVEELIGIMRDRGLVP